MNRRPGLRLVIVSFLVFGLAGPGDLALPSPEGPTVREQAGQEGSAVHPRSPGLKLVRAPHSTSGNAHALIQNDENTQEGEEGAGAGRPLPEPGPPAWMAIALPHDPPSWFGETRRFPPSHPSPRRSPLRC